MADLQMYADHFLNEMLNEAVLGVAYEAHRSMTQGTLFIDEDCSDMEEKYKITVEKGLDIFGQPINGSKKPFECQCPNCNRNMAASRFAPHLEKCMGMGRNSSRIASQRIANSGKLSSTMSEVGADEDVDDSNDVDWFLCDSNQPSKKSKKRKAERNNGSPRTSKAILTKPRPTCLTRPSSAGHSKEFVDQNDNIEISEIRSGNINQTMDLWEQHINATLTDAKSDKTTPGLHPNSGIVKKKKSKHNSTKKSKKRQINPLPIP
uniref:SAGA-associated factor 11 homolog n=1 Tax=Ciona savignyi TaxID=51511 RepID=H2Z7M8_CIOSA